MKDFFGRRKVGHPQLPFATLSLMGMKPLVKEIKWLSTGVVLGIHLTQPWFYLISGFQSLATNPFEPEQFLLFLFLLLLILLRPDNSFNRSENTK